MNRSTLRLMRSSRLSSGFRRRPAVITTILLVATSSKSPALMRWSATRLAPCRRSEAWPRAISLLASIRQMRLTTPPHCRAKAVMLPTSPPPPIMLTFMIEFSNMNFWPCSATASRLNATKGRHHLIRDRLYDFFQIRVFGVVRVTILLLSVKGIRLRSKFTVAAVKDAVAAQITVLASEARIVIAQALLDVEKLLGLPLGEVVHAP